MDANEKAIIEIEAYLDGHMEVGDRQAFEKRLENNPELLRQLNTHKLIREGMLGIGIGAFVEEVKTWDTGEEEEVKQVFIIPFWLKIASAAAVVVLLALFGLRQYASSQFSNEALIAEHQLPLFPDDGTRGENPGQELLDELNLDPNECGQLASLIEDYPKDPPNKYLDLHLLTGDCYMRKENYGLASEMFEAAMQLNAAKDVQALNLYWNQVLASLGMGSSNEEVLKLLEKVPQEATPAFIESHVNRLKQQLESPWRGWGN